jgi:flagellar basal body-associated protein FliL
MILEHDKKAKKSTKIILAVILVALAVGGYFGLNIYKTS